MSSGSPYTLESHQKRPKKNVEVQKPLVGLRGTNLLPTLTLRSSVVSHSWFTQFHKVSENKVFSAVPESAGEFVSETFCK